MANVIIYHPWIYLKGGAERTILEFVKRSKHNCTVLTNHFDSNGTFPEFNSINIYEVDRVSTERSFSVVGKAALKIMTNKISKPYDVLIISSEGVGDFLTIRNRGPIICYCHTPLKVLSDFETRKEYFKRNPGILTKVKFHLGMSVFKQFDKLAWRKYNYIFANSREVKGRIESLRLNRNKKIEVLNPGVDLERITPTWKYDKYFLAPGRIMWTKNLQLIIKSFLLSQAKMQGFKLIIAGAVDKKSETYLESLIELVGRDSSVEIVISPTDDELKKLYQEAFGILFAAFNEDWGIVPIEGMAAGKPVISINKGGPRESIINEVTGYLVESSELDYSRAIDRLIADDPIKMGKNARVQAEKFSWDNFSNRLDTVIDSLLK